VKKNLGLFRKPKKILVVLCSLIILMLLFYKISTPIIYASEAKNNYIMLRYENGKIENGESYTGTYNIFENNSLKKWSLGFRFITGENNFKLIIPCFYYKTSNGWQFGVEYISDSLGNEKIGPSFRFIKSISKMSIFSISTYYFDLKNNRNMIDLFLSLKNKKKLGWYYGVETWYYHTKNGTENFHFRPLKIGYKFKSGLAPFIMIQRKWNDKGIKTDAILTGLEIKF